jgi:hypothetical protein
VRVRYLSTSDFSLAPEIQVGTRQGDVITSVTDNLSTREACEIGDYIKKALFITFFLLILFG